MNRLEQNLHRILEDYPVAKTLIRDVYQQICGLLPVKNIMPHELVSRPGFFYGFHNICPWSPDNKQLLTHKISSDSLHNPRPGESVEIGYFSGDNFENYTSLSKTRSWNWQQGSMLQWLGPSSNVIFNDFDSGRNHARVLTLMGNEVLALDRPIAAVSPDGRCALSYSFERLRHGMPGYEYASGINREELVDKPRHDGLYVIDIASARANRIFSVGEIATYYPEPSFKDSFHFFSHCLFSPTSKRFVFFHRWLKPGMALKTRMISCNIDGTAPYIFPTDDMVSHIVWVDGSHILAFAGTRQGGRHYYLFTDESDEYSIVGEKWFHSDGHPNVSPDKRWLLTDTYPDRCRMQHLFLYDMYHDQAHEVLRLKIPFEYRNEIRCDFHPRWDRLGKTISFDSAHNGIRAHCTLDIDINKFTDVDIGSAASGSRLAVK